jgi:hypothetical protein
MREKRMTPVGTACTWLGVRLTLMTERGERERGEGPVSYIAVILMIAAVVAILITSDIGTRIVNLIKSSLSQVGTKGGIISG